MKTIGILLIVAGCLLGGVAYQMDTTVTTGARDFGYGISIPSVTVNNIGLMEERKNKLMIAGVLVIVGAIFTALGSAKKEESAGDVKCPFCAEKIKSEAKLCRFCGKDIPNSVQSSPTELEALMEHYKIQKIAGKYWYEVYKYDRLEDAVNYAKLQESKI